MKVSIQKKIDRILIDHPRFKEKFKQMYILKDEHSKYAITLDVKNMTYPIHWGTYGMKDIVNESDYPDWLKKLYFEANELYFEQMKMKVLLNENKKRPILNLLYVYGCLHGDAELVNYIKTLGQGRMIYVEATQKEFIQTFSERVLEEGYQCDVSSTEDQVLIQVEDKEEK